ncbi:MAG: glycosyl hydrolase [Ferruginibacter sp.]|nr:glycosyl hydrolase [Cytophagales bacterium]
MKKVRRNGLESLAIIALLCLLFCQPGLAQRKEKNAGGAVVSFDDKLYKGLEWRSIGPFRGGRSAAVTGVAGKPNLFYMGATGGGVWRTTDGGSSWQNISDGYFGGSIGAVAVSEYDPNVIYAGGGEVTVRGNVSSGYGVWKSQDAGKTWQFAGLPKARHVPRIRIHPRNPDLVYAAVLGNLYAPGEERGVYRSKDGGKNWERILFANPQAGAVDLTFDPSNPRILYASTWWVRRTPYDLTSGGPGSALWKSTDGGDTWKDISANDGLPKGALGIIGVTVSPVNPNRVWAIVENENGGVFRSEDGGEKWAKLNDDRNLRQRAWYYTRIYADTKNEDVVYVMNVSYHRSKDGGKTFQEFNAPHGDHHDLWIAPEDNQRLVIADDGGAQVSFDGGENWSTYGNQPTGQFYRVTTDNHFPYRIYGAQQDNSTLRIAHRTNGSAITEQDWEVTAGSESAHLAVDPVNPNVVYGGNYGGFLSRVDHQTKQERAINVWPDNPMGAGAEAMKYRFQWNYPIFFSPHNPKKLYTTSNHVHVSYNEGQTWEAISPDLTRNVKEKMGSSGGPITKDNTSVEYYCTIFAAAESPSEKDLIWTGSDDGLVHVTRDGGKQWENVTPKGMPEWMMINSIDPHPTVKGGAYVAGTRYKSGDFQPYLYRTLDYGKTWTKITNGIAEEHFTRVVRADPKRPGLLYCGTESGMYVSFDDGASWKPFQSNLPIVPITDLTIKHDNLIAATQGRGFYLIDDITPLHQVNNEVAGSPFHLYKPTPSYRMEGGSTSRRPLKGVGQNHPGGVLIHYYLKDQPDSTATITLDITQADGKPIKSFSNKAKDPKDKGEQLLAVKAGINRFAWDMRYPDAKKFEGMILWSRSGTEGPKAVPGTYKAKLTVGGQTRETDFEILADPRVTTSREDLQAQFDFLMEGRDKLSETHEAIARIREVRGQLKQVTGRVKEADENKPMLEAAKVLNRKLTDIEEALYQTKNRSSQDPLNFPIRLNDKLGNLVGVAGSGDYRPTDQSYAFKKEITGKIDEQLSKLKVVLQTDVPNFNKLVKEKGIDAVAAPASL